MAVLGVLQYKQGLGSGPQPDNGVAQPGVLYGTGVVNFTNVIITSFNNMYPMGFGTTDVRSLTMALNHVDVPGDGYSTWVGGSTGIRNPTIAVNSVYAEQALKEYLLTPAYVPNDYSTTDSVNYGISTYVPGTAPIPTVNTLHVGAGQTYASPAAAYDAAQHGDNIIVHPGSYDVAGFNSGAGRDIDKDVRFYGSTENPNDVTFTGFHGFNNHGFMIYPYRMGNIVGPGFFHIRINSSTDTWKRKFHLASDL
jgi:hypothetical protein